MTRTEHDSLGDVHVPVESFFGAQTYRAVTNFPISGRTAHSSLIRAYLRLKAAAALANQQCGAITGEQSRLITQAVGQLLQLTEQELRAHFPVDAYQAGAGTSQNMNANEVVANVANRIAGHALGTYAVIHPNDHVNRSQSTNDSYPTAMRLALLEESAALVREAQALSEALARKGEEWKSLPKSARTHLQDAVPITLGQEFTAYAVTLDRCGRALARSRDELRELGIGGSAAGTGLTVPSGYREAIVRELSPMTGEELRSAPDLREAMQSQWPVTQWMSTLRLMALELTRICNDLRLLASGPLTGLAELELPAVQPGSSIMPGKVNPSILEMANQTWFSVLGYEQSVAYCAQAGQLELNVMMPMMAFSSLEATCVSAQALRILRERCIEGLKANSERLRRYFEATPQVATALSPKLGYDRTAELVKESLAQGVSVIELVRSRGLLSDAELERLLDVRVLTGADIQLG